jgi:bisphosphoglycerate-independent phosphoglycerate mutase (AlkP superfamily)
MVTSENVETGLDKLTLSSMQPTGVLADVSPTILDFLEINKPSEMNGQSLKDII